MATPSEAFTTTVTVVAYAAIVIAMPVVLYQLYAFVLPAFTPTERRVAQPLLLMIPVLFIGGAAFGYFLVVPAALKFLLHFNRDQFNVQLRASEYYSFLIVTLIALGLVFQIPMGIVAVTRLGIVTPQQLSHNRRYAYLILAIVAMLLPGTDPVTMLIELAPLLALFELSVILARITGTRTERGGAAEPEPPGSPAS